MSTVLTNLGSRLLGRLLPQEEAGACTICPGPCGNAYYYICSGGTLWYANCSRVYSCDCGCIPSSCTYLYAVGSC
ncbi:hypothetical protein J2S41_003857 [Catenuloplanes atrovinosus]|uniref:Uncharacterized protein n=1 Tax=Catenuloplanes atrovinosus TaxID=137266 RepID=A0AAE4CBM4_9ACTN|nr:hypothetical protein [Catenuloplanes atrovinosus]